MIRGVLAGAAGTALMETVWYARYRREGGTSGLLEWETAAGLDSFQDAPAPAQVGKRVVEGLLQRELGPLVWSTAYLVLRPTGISKPMRDYDAKTLWKDASAHLAFGLGTAASFKLLAGR